MGVIKSKVMVKVTNAKTIDDIVSAILAFSDTITPYNTVIQVNEAGRRLICQVADYNVSNYRIEKQNGEYEKDFVASIWDFKIYLHEPQKEMLKVVSLCRDDVPLQMPQKTQATWLR